MLTWQMLASKINLAYFLHTQGQFLVLHRGDEVSLFILPLLVVFFAILAIEMRIDEEKKLHQQLHASESMIFRHGRRP